MSYTTGHLDTHDVTIDAHGPLLVNTLFNCIARPSERHSFEVLWQATIHFRAGGLKTVVTSMALA